MRSKAELSLACSRKLLGLALASVVQYPLAGAYAKVVQTLPGDSGTGMPFTAPAEVKPASDSAPTADSSDSNGVSPSRRPPLGGEGEPVDDVDDRSPQLSGYFLKCSAPPAFPNHYVICVDAYPSGAPVVTGLPRSGHVIRPNTPVLVLVRRRHTDSVRVQMDGTRGIYRPKMNDQVPSATATPDVRAAQKRAAETFQAVVSTHSFAPRLPGKSDITVRTYTDGSLAALAGEETIELEVEATYGGALRIGIGLVGGGAVDREYVARQAAQSGQAQVASSSSGNFNAELVLGFAPYIDFFWGGRGYAGFENLRRFPFGLSPYVGIGIVNAAANSLEVFKSIYLGVEFEPTPNFSVAFGWVGRRVTRLADGVMLGSPTGDGPVPTTMGFDSGWGVVVNVSPDFLRLAQQSGSSFYKR